MSSIARPIAALIASVFLILPASSAAASLPADSTAILSGAPSLFDALPVPVGFSQTTNESVSQNGRYVAFVSSSDGLVDGDDDRVLSNVYVKDRATGAVTHVNKRTGAAGEPAHASCDDPVISDDGARVAFTCDGPLDDADTNGLDDVYVRDLSSATTILVSRAGNLGAVAESGARYPTISATGEYVAFSSDGKNLHPDAANGGELVFRRQIGGANEVVIVSRRDAAHGNTPVIGRDPSISDDGQKVAFTSFAAFPKAHPDDTNGFSDVFVRDVPANTLVLASRAPLAGAAGNDHSDTPALAGNGEAVAFQSNASNFAGEDTDNEPDVYWRPLTGTPNQQNTALVNITAASETVNATEPSIDDSGNIVGFLARGPLNSADTNSTVDAYVKDVGGPTNALHLVSRADGDTGAVGNADADSVSLSGDAMKAVVGVENGRLTPGVDPRQGTVILRDLSATPKRTFPVARPAGDAPFVNQGGSAGNAVLSADGRFAAFVAHGTGLGLPDEAPGGVVVRDRVTGEVTFASRADGPDGAPLPENGATPAISADGRRVAFVVTGDVPQRGVWVRDIVANRTWLASRADGANGAPGNGDSQLPSLDADGSRVAFISNATNLGNGDTDTGRDAHLRDLETDQTQLVSRADGLNGAKANGFSNRVDLSADGFRAAFITGASNLGDGDTDAVDDVHLRDLSTQTTRLVSATENGTPSNGPENSVSIDASGERVAFTSNSTNLLSATQPFFKVFVRDLAADTLVLASRADGPDGAPANGAAQQGVISPDGGYVVFTAIADNLAPGAPSTRQAYRRDLAAGRTQLASRNSGPTGEPGTRTLAGDDISQGGHCVSFRGAEPWHGGQTDGTSAYVRAFSADCASTPTTGGGPGSGDAGAGGGNGGGPGGADDDKTAPVLSRAKVSRKRFRVGPKATALAAAAKRGTVLSFRSSEAVTLRVTFERALPRKRFRRAGTLSRSVRAGNGKVALSGRLGKRRMAAGTYRATLVATDAAGNRSKPVRVKFTIVKG